MAVSLRHGPHGASRFDAYIVVERIARHGSGREWLCRAYASSQRYNQNFRRHTAIACKHASLPLACISYSVVNFCAQDLSRPRHRRACTELRSLRSCGAESKSRSSHLLHRLLRLCNILSPSGPSTNEHPRSAVQCDSLWDRMAKRLLTTQTGQNSKRHAEVKFKHRPCQNSHLGGAQSASGRISTFPYMSAAKSFKAVSSLELFSGTTGPGTC